MGIVFRVLLSIVAGLFVMIATSYSFFAWGWYNLSPNMTFFVGDRGVDTVIVFAIIVMSGIITSVGLMMLFVRFRKNRLTNHCEVCDYSLTGNVSGTCPECGMVIPKE